LNKKLAFPLISAVLALIAVPIALGTRRGGIPLAVTLGVAVCFLYQISMYFSRTLGLSGTLPPLLSAWTANLIFSLFGIYLIMCVKK
jgi:lipopolysaccharide export system permease protein